jgi:predicted anti-sigma-YlaC factor YlaD
VHLDETGLNEYLDGALPQPARQEAEAHLAACPQCAARLRELQAVFIALETLPETPLARDLSAGVVARLPAGQAPVLGRGLTWALAAQAVLAIGCLIFAWQFADFTPVSQAVAGLQGSLVEALRSAWANLSAQGQADLASLAQNWSENLAAARTLTEPLGIWPATAWSAGLAALGLLWLAGNGLVLRRLIGSPPLTRSP